MANLSTLKLKEDSANWWLELNDIQKEIIITELYCKRNNIILE